MERLKRKIYYLVTEPVVTDMLCIIIPVLLFGLVAMFTGCSTLKEVPVQTVEKIEYRDSLVYVHDTLTIPIPYEKIVEVVPEVDTSYLETSVAKSTAYLDTAKRKLHHTLEQKGSIKYIHDTVHVVEYVDRVYEKEVPVEVEVIKYKRDALFWVLVGWALLCIAYAVIKIFLVK
jgi:hypothetical protein